MSHARSQHPNAPLTPEGRARMVVCVLDRGWGIEATVPSSHSLNPGVHIAVTSPTAVRLLESGHAA